MLDEAFVDDAVAFGAEGLFEEGEEDGDDDAGFEAFAEADEEDCLVLFSKCWSIVLVGEVVHLALRTRLAPFCTLLFVPFAMRFYTAL